MSNNDENTIIQTIHRYRFLLITLGLVLLAAWLRLWQLSSIPPGLWFDEAYNGLDAVWMLKKNNWPVFLPGNNGREALYHYLLAISISGLGETTYAIRLVSALLGILTIPLMYRWSLLVFSGSKYQNWLAIIAVTGLVTSFWALLMNRTAYRANLLPLFVILVSYFFWRGWQSTKIRYFLLAGSLLGMSQYTYLSARLLPLVFILFVLTQTCLLWRTNRPQLKTGWVGLVVMGIASAIVAAPLLLFFVENPELFGGRTGSVAIKVDWSAEGVRILTTHLWQAARVFVDGQDPNWRHHLLGRPVFDWFNTMGFWVGLGLTLRHYRRPVNLFLLILLAVMWLPAPLAEPAFHTLRLAGILPAYYVLVAIGQINLFYFLQKWLPYRVRGYPGLGALTALLLFSGGQTIGDYFYRWGNSLDVYRAFDGPVVDMADYFTNANAPTDSVIPYYFYTHASLKYLLNNNFDEEVFLPAEVSDRFSRLSELSLVVPEYPPDDSKPPAYVWLHREGANNGTAYVSAVNRDLSLDSLLSDSSTPVTGQKSEALAHRFSIEPQSVSSLFFNEMPQQQAAVRWGNNLRLTGYEFIPAQISAGDYSHLYLAWKLLGFTGLKQKMFLQLLDSQGQPINQQEIDPISRKMYRWRDDGLVFEQHLLQMDSALDAGLYFVRLGFFDPQTGQRLSAFAADDQPVEGDEVVVGPLTVSANGIDPTVPQHQIEARFDRKFLLYGYRFLPHGESTMVKLYWQSLGTTDINYTVFLQLLDAQNQVVAQSDAQPLQNIYPTSHWQIGDVLTAQFTLPVPIDSLMSNNRLVTGMYNLETGERLSVYNAKGDLLPDDMLQLAPFEIVVD